MSNELTKHTLRMTDSGYKSTISTDHCEIYLASEIDPIIAQLEADKAELASGLTELYNSCNPDDVTPHKKSKGIDLGKFYVGGCGIPSNESIHKAHSLIQKHAAK